MAKDAAGRWSRAASDRLLLLFLAGGLLFIICPQLEIAKETYPEWLLHSSVELGKAFAVAGILGLVIDRALKNDLVREAVATSLGHLLPERLKPELRWLYDQKVLVTQAWDVILEHEKVTHRVAFHATVIRRIENISGEPTEIKIAGGVDEWFSDAGECEIVSCSWKRIRPGDEDNQAEPVKIVPQKEAFGIAYGAGKCHLLREEHVVVLSADEIVEVLLAYKLHMPDHGMEFLTYRYLIDRPKITIRKPDSLNVSITFSHRDKYDQELRTDEPVFAFTLERVLLPHQDIKVYWHDADAVRTRTGKYGLQVTSQ